MQARKPFYDALIVGAGPAGSLTAWLLAREGLCVAVLEAAERIERKVCGEYLAPSGVVLLHQLGLGPWLESQFRPVVGMKLAAPSGRGVEARFPARGGRPSLGYSLDRQRFDQGLLDLARQAGAEVHMECRVRERSFAQGIHTLIARDGRAYHGRLLIGADGRKSWVARSLGLTLPHKPHRVALHCYLETRRPSSNHGEMHILPGGMYIGINPVEERLANFVVVCDAGQIKELGGPKGVIAHAFGLSTHVRAAYRPPPGEASIRATYPIAHKVRGCIAEQAALVGDAAGFIDPLTGEGINNALWMARELSREVMRAHGEGRLSDAQPYLQRYARNKRRFFREKTILNRAFQWVIRNRAVTEAIATFLVRSQARADIFIGIVGNVYRLTDGLWALLKTLVARVPEGPPLCLPVHEAAAKGTGASSAAAGSESEMENRSPVAESIPMSPPCERAV